jgi:hypothetical protein
VGAAAARPEIVARIRLPAPVAAVATGGGSVWALTPEADPGPVGIDPRSNRIVGEPTPLPAGRGCRLDRGPTPGLARGG